MTSGVRIQRLTVTTREKASKGCTMLTR